MSQPCAIDTCKRASRALCHCCQQNVCIPHLNEHNDLLNSQLYPLVDEINVLGERLKTFNIQDTVEECRQKLEQWREDSHKKIDYFFEKKSQELDRLVNEKLDKQRKSITQIQSKVSNLIREQEATRNEIDALTSTISDIQKEMDKTEKTRFRIYVHSLPVDDNLVQFEEIYEHEFDPSIFSSTHKTIEYSAGSFRALAANDRVLLVHQKPNLSFLNAELTTIKQVLWPHGIIDDICWSTVLGRFIIIENGKLHLVNEDTMSIETLEVMEKYNWFSCTCYNDQLFLSTSTWGSSIVEIDVSSLPMAVTKEWKFPTTCTTNEWIDDIIYNNGILAMVIRNKIEQSIRMELRSPETMNCLRSLALDVIYNKDIAFRCCSLDRNGWFLVDFNSARLLHITRDGNIENKITYKDIPYHVAAFASNMVISAENRINFHKI